MKVYEQHHQEQTMSKDHLSFSYLYATKVFLFDHLGFVLQIQSQTFGFMQGSANTMVFTVFKKKKSGIIYIMEETGLELVLLTSCLSEYVFSSYHLVVVKGNTVFLACLNCDSPSD